MKMKKWVVLTACTSLLAGLLSGCASGGGGNTIKIGANYEMSGDVATFGQSQLNGAKLAVKEINAAGGVLGKQIEIIEFDNKSSAPEATIGMQKLISDKKVVAVLGATTSTNTLAITQVAADNKVPVLTPSATNPAVTFKDGKLNEYAFRACFIDPFQGTVMANFSTNSLKAKTAAIYVDSSSDYAKGLAQFFKDSFVKNGGEIVAEEAYVAKDTDFNATLNKIKSKKPDVIYVPGYYGEVGLIVKQARELGITVPMMGGDGWDSPTLVELAGADGKALNNTFISNHYAVDDPDPKIKSFVDAYKAEYNVTPDAMSVLGYDGMQMLADAIKRAGEVDSVKIRDALEATKDLQVVTGTITLDANHDPVKSAVVLEYVDGKQVFKEKVNP